MESCAEAGDLVLRWTPICEGDPANSRQCARVGRLDKRAELRLEERSGIWGHQHNYSDWFIEVRVGLKRCSRVPFFDDGVSHRRVRREKKVDPSGSREARYGLRGVRVGEASNPGPSQARAMFHDTEVAADSAIASLERELTSLDTSDDEPMVRPAGSRNVVPRVANARFPGHSRHLRRVPVSRSITPISSTVPAASGELQLMERGRVADAVPVMDMSVNDSDLEPPLEGNRFAALGDHDSGSAAQGAPSAETVRQRRRLVLVFDPPAEGEVGGQESEADIESLPGAASEVETVEVPEHTVDSDPIPMERRLRAAPRAFASFGRNRSPPSFRIAGKSNAFRSSCFEGGVPSSNQGLDARNLERS